MKGSVLFSRTTSLSVNSGVHFGPGTGALICTTMVWKESAILVLPRGRTLILNLLNTYLMSA